MQLLPKNLTTSLKPPIHPKITSYNHKNHFISPSISQDQWKKKFYVPFRQYLRFYEGLIMINFDSVCMYSKILFMSYMTQPSNMTLELERSFSILYIMCLKGSWTSFCLLIWLKKIFLVALLKDFHFLFFFL